METLSPNTLTQDEIELVQKHRREKEFGRGFNTGLQAAWMHLMSLADQCGGGDGTGAAAATYRVAAHSLDSLRR